MGLLSTIAQAKIAQEDLEELRLLLNSILEVDAEESEPVEVTFRVGNTAIVQTQDRIFFQLGNRIIDLAELDRLLLSFNAIDDREHQPPIGGGGGSGAVSSVFGRTGAVTAQQTDYDSFFTTPVEAQSVARNAITGNTPINYSPATGEFSIQFASASQSGAITALDWSTFSGKQDANARLNAIATQTNPATSKFFQLNTNGTVSFVDPPTGGGGGPSNYDPANVNITGGTIALTGNLTTSSDGATSTNPRLIGFTNFSSGEAISLRFGDEFNAIQALWGGSVQVRSFNSLRLNGRAGAAPEPFFAGDEACNVAIGTGSGVPFAVKLAPSFTGNSFEIRDSAYQLVSAFDSQGNYPSSKISGLTPLLNAKQDASARLNAIVTQTNPASAKLFQLNTNGTVSFVDPTTNARLDAIANQPNPASPKFIQLGTAGTINFVDPPSGGGGGSSNYDPANVNITGGTIALTGDLSVNTAGSSTSTPRVLGFTNFASGRTARFQFGDYQNSIQNAQGGALQLQSWWQLELNGCHQGSYEDFNTSSNARSNVLVHGKNDLPVLTIRSSLNQSQPLFRFVDQSYNVIAAFDSQGNYPSSKISGLATSLAGKQNQNSRLDTIATQANPVSAKLVQLNTNGGITFVDPPSSGTSSVFGRTGAVTAQADDYSWSQITGLRSMSTQADSSVSIVGGSINNTLIGNVSPSSAAFTAISTSQSATIQNSSPTVVPLTIRTVTSQSANCFETRRSDNTIGFQIFASGSLEVGTGSFYRHSGNQVLGPRITGWGTPSGTATYNKSGSFPMGTALTTLQLTGVLGQLILDLRTHGIIGS